MPAQNHEWTLNASDLGCSEGPSYADQHKPDGQIDFAPDFANARQDVPYQHDFHKYADVNPAPARVDVADPNPDCGVPNPGAGDAGQPLPFDQVAPEEYVDRQLADRSLDLDGHGAPEASDISAAFGG